MESKNREELYKALKLLDEFTLFRKFACPPIYLIGGSACILGKYIDRATLDFDIVDIGYSAETGMYFNVLGDKDVLDFGLTTIPGSYQERAVHLKGFENIRVFVLSREDIIVAKLGRYSAIDKEDISALMKGADIPLLSALIEETGTRTDLGARVKVKFLENVKRFREEFHV